jgi:hypothetical protein
MSWNPGNSFGESVRRTSITWRVEQLRVLLECWAELPESLKDAVMEMVRGGG